MQDQPDEEIPRIYYAMTLHGLGYYKEAVQQFRLLYPLDSYYPFFLEFLCGYHADAWGGRGGLPPFPGRSPLAEMLPLSDFKDIGALEKHLTELYDSIQKQIKSETYVYDSDTPYKRSGKKIGRNDPCPCGSGKNIKTAAEKSSRRR